MLAVDVIVMAENNPDHISQGIMRYMGRPFSHIAFLKDGHLFHAIEPGVVFQPVEEYENHTIVGRKVVHLDCDERGWERFIAEHRGKEYSQSQYLGVLTPRLRAAVRNGADKFFCSELVAFGLHTLRARCPAGEIIDIVRACGDLIDIDFVTPAQVWDVIPG